jgi:hypothetical protein
VLNVNFIIFWNVTPYSSLGKPTYHNIGRICFHSFQCRRWGEQVPPKHCSLCKYTDLYFGKVYEVYNSLSIPDIITKII